MRQFSKLMNSDRSRDTAPWMRSSIGRALGCQPRGSGIVTRRIRHMYSEFLDTEWYYDTVPVSKPTYKRLPVWLVRSLAQPSRVRKILTTDEDILDELSLSVAQHGVLEPVILKLDRNGRITLFDGHHRVIVAERLGIQEVPVVIEVCKSLSLETTPISEVIHELMT